MDNFYYVIDCIISLILIGFLFYLIFLIFNKFFRKFEYNKNVASKTTTDLSYMLKSLPDTYVLPLMKNKFGEKINKTWFAKTEKEISSTFSKNCDVALFSKNVCHFFKNYKCENTTLIQHKLNSLFVLPDGSFINKNYSLSQGNLDEIWKQKKNSIKQAKHITNNNMETPFTEGYCTKFPLKYINLFGDCGNEKNFKLNPQKTICGCVYHDSLLKMPNEKKRPKPYKENDLKFSLNMLTPGKITLKLPFLGCRKWNLSWGGSTGSFLINKKKKLIMADPCSSLQDGVYKIDDVVVKQFDVNALRTKRPELFKKFMLSRTFPTKLRCLDQQVDILEI